MSRYSTLTTLAPHPPLTRTLDLHRLLVNGKCGITSIQVGGSGDGLYQGHRLRHLAIVEDLSVGLDVVVQIMARDLSIVHPLGHQILIKHSTNVHVHQAQKVDVNIGDFACCAMLFCYLISNSPFSDFLIFFSLFLFLPLSSPSNWGLVAGLPGWGSKKQLMLSKAFLI